MPASCILEPPPPPGFRRLRLAQSWGWQHLLAGGDGPPLFLIHGLGGSHRDFLSLLPHLGRHFTCLVPDLPGFGLSAKPDASYRTDFFCQTLVELTEALGVDRADWVGHSMGGQIVLWLAASRPERVGRVAAIGPAGGHHRRQPAQRCLLWLLTNGDRFRFFHPRLLDLGLSHVFGQPYFGPDTWPGMAEVRRYAHAFWSTPERPRLERALIRSAKGVLDHSLLDRLGGLARPVLLVEGQGDRVIPARQTADLWGALPPGNQRVSLPGGHMPPYLEPEGLTQVLLAFLRQNVDTGRHGGYTTDNP
ncbi:MAG: alpha/beta hydrolase [Desulfarculus sp.]|nr:alpha/beta hydrolase [Desulfarculus sp.]